MSTPVVYIHAVELTVPWHESFFICLAGRFREVLVSTCGWNSNGIP